MDKEGVEEIKDTWEWIQLVMEAKRIGLSPEQVRKFLEKHKGES